MPTNRPSPWWLLLFLTQVSANPNLDQEKFLCIFWGSKEVKGSFANDFWEGDAKIVLFQWIHQVSEGENRTY